MDVSRKNEGGGEGARNWVPGRYEGMAGWVGFLPLGGVLRAQSVSTTAQADPDGPDTSDGIRSTGR